MAVVSGQVLDHAGQGVPGVVVSAALVGARRFMASPMTCTDLSGRWALDLSAGAWRVRETGFATHDVTVGDSPVSTSGESVAATQLAEEPTTDDIARILARRQQEFSPRDDRDMDAPPSETRPLVESPIDVGDMTAFLRERRGE